MFFGILRRRLFGYIYELYINCLFFGTDLASTNPNNKKYLQINNYEKYNYRIERLFWGYISPLYEKQKFALYKELNLLGDYCMEHLSEQKSKEIIEKIEDLYKQKDLFVCNAIENEFLTVLTRNTQPSELTEQLKILPESLWEVYIKVLFETHKNDKL